MQEQSLPDKKEEEFIGKIIGVLKDNGFPSNPVSLPLEKLYEAADNRGLNFNKILIFFEEHHRISHETTSEKIIFTQQVSLEAEQPMNNQNPGDMDYQEMMRKGEEMMRNMSPDELSKIREMIDNMSEEERSSLFNMAKDWQKNTNN